MSTSFRLMVARDVLPLAVALYAAAASAQPTVIVSGRVVKPPPGAGEAACKRNEEAIEKYEPQENTTVGLYAAPNRHPKQPTRGQMDKYTTKKDGMFQLHASEVGIDDSLLFVLYEEPSDWTAHARPVRIDKPDSRNFANATIQAPICLEASSPSRGVRPADAGSAAAAIVGTHQVKAWAGVEQPERADAAAMDAVAKIEEKVQPEDRARFTKALAEATEELRAHRPEGLPLLASLVPVDFAERLVAAAPAHRWMADPKPRSADVTGESDGRGYSDRDGRFEGAPRTLVATSVKLLSFTEGALPIDPKNQNVELTWPKAPARYACVEASPTKPNVSWSMRKVVGPDKSSFTWDLSVAHAAGVPADSLGIVVRDCGAGPPEHGVVLPARFARARGVAPAYELAFQSPAELWSIDVKVSQQSLQDSATALPAPSVAFDRKAARPVVKVTIPREGLQPGLVVVDVSGRGGDGPLQPDPISFLHRAAR